MSTRTPPVRLPAVGKAGRTAGSLPASRRRGSRPSPDRSSGGGGPAGGDSADGANCGTGNGAGGEGGNRGGTDVSSDTDGGDEGGDCNCGNAGAIGGVCSAGRGNGVTGGWGAGERSARGAGECTFDTVAIGWDRHTDGSSSGDGCKVDDGSNGFGDERGDEQGRGEVESAGAGKSPSPPAELRSSSSASAGLSNIAKAGRQGTGPAARLSDKAVPTTNRDGGVGSTSPNSQ
jgi:hypothetical protein